MDLNRIYFYIGPRADELVFSLSSDQEAQDLVRAIHKAADPEESGVHSVAAQDQDGATVQVFIPANAVVTFFAPADVLYGDTPT